MSCKVYGLENMCVVCGLISSRTDRLIKAAQYCCALMYHPPSNCGWYVQCFKSRLIRFYGQVTYMFMEN